MTKQSISFDRYKIHKCYVCDTCFFWSDYSCWHGVIKNENEKALEKCCSRKCFRKLKQKDLDDAFRNI